MKGKARVGRLVVAVTMVALGYPPLAGQEDEGSNWAFETEVGASVFFGATDQTTVATKFSADRRDAAIEIETDLQFLYGETSEEDGEKLVNKRFWRMGYDVNYRGFSWVNPYIFFRGLSSLEKKIRRRYNGGAGAKVTAQSPGGARLDLSLAVLAERTVLLDAENGEQELLARWTGTVRYRRPFSEERLVFETRTEYNPVFDQFDNYTIQHETGLSFRVSQLVRLRVSFLDNYDSRARQRGARSNNDGRMLFSVLSAF